MQTIKLALVPLGWGVAAGLWTPRGPLTGGEALWSVALSAAVGVLAGWAGRSRWAMLVAPAVFVAAVEVARAPVAGPSVDAPHLSLLGVTALVTGRGVHGLFTVLPMIVGAAYGAALTRDRLAGRPIPRYLRRVGVATLAAAVAAVTVLAAIPARTAAIPGPNAVAELTTVDVGGYDLGLMIRGHDRAAPVLLFVPGAPGGMEKGSMRRHLAGLEQHFVVATLDRRGGGTSYPALDADPPIGLESGIADTVAVTHYLRDRFGQDRVYLLAHSGGSLLGALTAARHPDLYAAYIGTGQAVDLPESDRAFHADLGAGGDPPPYDDFYPYEPIVTNSGGEVGALDGPEYTLLDKLHTVTSMLDTWQAQYPDLQQVDLRTDVPRLAIPAYFVQGADEKPALAKPFAQWYDRLEAPVKRLLVLDGAGHRPMFEQPDRFVAAMTGILAENDPARRGR
ncbi:alpha/beta fold hydrolase [Asanoa siamensis]|uniref:AB hydrolase-1 domain-containing protein n=1 Tax=Asanoa siamensis TaxID=926357 RepID=A0ABQ4CW18_9ACTN|nr:alpha/beta hydrolase [Asanoa siamensis]GIF75460.1 hypothetical protein Asi02nite_49780 [Asanoa siamensis]